MALGVSAPAVAQSAGDVRRPLVVNPAVLAAMDLRSPPRPAAVVDDNASGSVLRWEIFNPRSVQSLLDAASTNRTLRAADAAVGIALVTLGSRRNLPASAIYVGMHAVRLGVSRDLPGALRPYAIEPHLENGGFSISVTRK